MAEILIILLLDIGRFSDFSPPPSSITQLQLKITLAKKSNLTKFECDAWMRNVYHTNRPAKSNRGAIARAKYDFQIGDRLSLSNGWRVRKVGKKKVGLRFTYC